MLEDILRSCANPEVAEAAVRSIGASFADEVQSVARRRGMSLGLYVASLVWQFGDGATAAERVALHEAIRSSDQPILHGLAHILVRALVSERHATVRPDRPFGGIRAVDALAAVG